MYHRFRWTGVAARRNSILAEFEPFQPYFLLALAGKAQCRTFVDVGANIGAYSIFMSRVPAIRRVIAFEANARTARELRANLALNGVRAEVREAAVSDRKGKVEFGVAGRYAGNNAIVETSIHVRTTFRNVVSVDAVTLDDELRGVEGPVCIKADVEGHEPSVVRGAEKTLRNIPAIIQIEDYRDEITPALENLGYTLLTKIGPDCYFTNIASLIEPKTVIALYEEACRALIKANHEHKSVTLQGGDFGLRISGKTYDRARRLMRKILGRV
jgi:FkbM family methyltransferase